MLDSTWPYLERNPTYTRRIEWSINPSRIWPKVQILSTFRPQMADNNRVESLNEQNEHS